MSAVSTTSAKGLDPITYEVVRHRLWSINDEACTALIHASGSPVVHASDFNFAIYTADGDMAVVGMLYMIPVGTMSMLVRTVRERFGDTVVEGDVFFCNDPYVAAAHQNDIGLVAPLFRDGELVGWTGCTAHELDVGGMTPGSWCPGATEVHQEGIRIPPVRIRRAGEIVEDLWDILMTASRLPTMLAMDLTAILAAHGVANRRLQELMDRYGADGVVAAMRMSIEQTETSVREALRALPDGEFRHVDYLDHDGLTNEIYEVRCALRKSGDEIVIDFTGTSPQAPGFVNSTKASTIGAVLTGLFPLLGADTPSWNEGVLRPVEIVLPESSLVNPSVPAPVSSSSVAGAWVASHAVVGALSKLLVAGGELAGEATAITDGTWPLLNLGGVNQYGEPFGDMFLDPSAWGGGAYAQRDGVDGGGAFVGPKSLILDVETKENAVPVLYLWRRLRRDSGGPGRMRGGVTAEFAVTPYGVDAIGTVLATHGVAQPNCAGLFGGLPGGGSGYELVIDTDLFERMGRTEIPTAVADAGGERRPLEAKTPLFMLNTGDVINIIPEGGGGFGDPLERDAVAVAKDVAEALVSASAALAVYGVEVTADGTVSDAPRAAMLRARRQAAGPPREVVPAPEGAVGARTPCGDALQTVVIGGERFWECRSCEHPLGPAAGNWKHATATLELDREGLGTGMVVDPRMAVTAFLCPACGRSLDVEVHRRGDEPRHDMSIHQMGSTA